MGSERSGDDRAVRVAILDHRAELGDPERAIERLLPALPADCAEISVILFAPGPLEGRLRAIGCRVDVLAAPRRVVGQGRRVSGAGSLPTIRTVVVALPFSVRLGMRLRRLDVDVVHTASVTAHLIGVLAVAVARRPLVWHVHDRISSDRLTDRAVGLVRYLARRVPRHVIATSRATAETLRGVSRLSIAYPGLESERSAPTRVAQPDAPVIGIIGPITAAQGQSEFVQAAALVLERQPTARFRVIGSGSSEDAYVSLVQDEIDSLGLGGRVEVVLGTDDPSAEIDRLSACVDATVAPVPFGNVVAEAMARGVPVVASRVAGIEEILEPGTGDVFGTLVPPGDVRTLASGIIAILDHPVRALARATAARTYAVEQFSIHGTAAVVLQVWEDVGVARRDRSLYRRRAAKGHSLARLARR